jgi:hypothetical protein
MGAFSGAGAGTGLKQRRTFDLLRTARKTSAKDARTMGSPQDPRTARRKRERRAKKNAEWELKRARENAEAAAPKAPAKTAT